MLAKGIDTTIRDLIAQLPKGTNLNGANAADFEALLAPLAKEITEALAKAATTGATSTTTSSAATTSDTATTATGAAPASRLSAHQMSLLRDQTSPILELLPSTLTAGDAQYNQREVALRDRLDLNGIERHLREYANQLDVSYDGSDLDGILRNAGYDAVHLGSSERYMAAVEKYIGEAENNYRQRATNKDQSA